MSPEAIAESAAKAAAILKDKGVEERFHTFTSEPDKNQLKIRTPSQAVTKFQMEQALGDWAESSVCGAINRSGEYKAIPFGDNDKTLSEAENFKDLYRQGKEREQAFGKRSDLLLFKADTPTPDDACGLSGPESEELCGECVAALEVRSSRTSVDRFTEYVKTQIDLGNKPTRTELSFTIKVEDLEKVYRWISRNKKPVIYVQVFFDSVYAINFGSAFEYINEKGKKLKLEKPARSAKPTIMVPLSYGQRVGDVEHPDFAIVHNKHANGRHDIYAEPSGGKVSINLPELLSLL